MLLPNLPCVLFGVPQVYVYGVAKRRLDERRWQTHVSFSPEVYITVQGEQVKCAHAHLRVSGKLKPGLIGTHYDALNFLVRRWGRSSLRLRHLRWSKLKSGPSLLIDRYAALLHESISVSTLLHKNLLSVLTALLKKVAVLMIYF